MHLSLQRPRYAILALLAVLVVVTSASSAPGDEWQARESQLVAVVRARFYDRARAEAWSGENQHFCKGVHDRAGFDEAARQAVQKLGRSHTAFYTADEPRYHGLRAIFPGALNLRPDQVAVESIGVDVTPDGFVRVIFAGSPAASSGLRRGDRILRADDRPFQPIASFRGREGKRVTLSVQRHKDAKPLEIVVVPRRIDPRQEWLDDQEKGARVVDHGSKKIAIMRLFSAAGEAHEERIRDAIAGPFAGADALILDLRDGWGGAAPTFLNLFNRTPPVLEQKGRDGKGLKFDTQWRKPLVLLINEGSKSGKEIVAYAVKKHKLGKLVGTSSGGAVLAGTPIRFDDRSILYLAVADVRVDGETLEGVGVRPDEPVTDALPFADGRDPQLERALDVAAKE
ncbi:S41 family peptidase [Aquisphaera insulae]|uniref:S41 family peptidase n=1 Tax=Aquisphaera insulae TaxID=2712864 RepID=UPI0013EAF0B5|nr:S41 family peptidase [Aquisphaera insulae]